MELSRRLSTCHLLLLSTFLQILLPVCSIGVNYGTTADNLPSPKEVAQFLKESTIIDRIKIFDMNSEIMKAFANTGIYVTITVPNGDIPSLTDFDKAGKWVQDKIKPYYPDTKIRYIAVGNEILHWGTKEQIDNVVPAMKTLHEALDKVGMGDIKVTTPHSLGILLSSDPPSSGAFRPGWDVGIIKPMLEFLNRTQSGFMVNPYPYFGYSPGNDSYALFRPNKGFVDPKTGNKYDNMFDGLMDAVYSGMKKLGYADVPIIVGETGWPSLGEPWLTWVNMENAKSYNGAMIKKSTSKDGTPLMPGKSFEIYIFALFNENQKPGSLAERNFGLFKPDFTEVYDIGVRNGTAPTFERDEVIWFIVDPSFEILGPNIFADHVINCLVSCIIALCFAISNGGTRMKHPGSIISNEETSKSPAGSPSSSSEGGGSGSSSGGSDKSSGGSDKSSGESQSGSSDTTPYGHNGSPAKVSDVVAAVVFVLAAFFMLWQIVI